MSRTRVSVLALAVLLSLWPSSARAAFHLEYVEGVERSSHVTSKGDLSLSEPRTPRTRSDVPETITAPPVRYSQGWGSVEQRIAAAWPGDDSVALAIASCETGGTFNPTIRNPSGKYRGLFQADSAFSQSYAGTSDAASLSVEEQTAMAWRGYQDRGASPWPVCGR